MLYRTEQLSAEITKLDQFIAYTQSLLDGLAKTDPATRLLREQLADLAAKREALTRAREDSTYADDKLLLGVGSFMGLACTGLLIVALTKLAARDFQLGVSALVAMVLVLAFTILAIDSARRGIREYRKTHARGTRER